MTDYLNGYLASIPKSEYDKIVTFLKDNIAEKLGMPEERFQTLLSRITTDKASVVSERVVSSIEKPSDTYNDFFSKVYIDLSYLFKVINLLYNAVEGYSDLSASYFSDIKGEIDKLQIMTEGLLAKENYSSNSTVRTETFGNTEYFETLDDSTGYLFCDRDGSPLNAVGIVHNDTDSMITLGVVRSEDLLHGSDGKPKGRISLSDYRGVPVKTYSGPENAVDNSPSSYWDCSTVSPEPIMIGMSPFEGGGAYVKFKVLLPAVCDVTEVSITPYCIYPVEICDILVGDTRILYTPETTGDTATFRTPKVSSDEVTVIMRQKNYIHSTEVSNAKKEEAEELWIRLFDKGKRPERNEFAEYEKYSSLKEKEMDIWNKEYIRRREAGK